jgi:hypothetical protein
MEKINDDANENNEDSNSNDPFLVSLFILQNYKEGIYQKGNPMPRL